jgi:Family of unknown function (DUF6454)
MKNASTWRIVTAALALVLTAGGAAVARPEAGHDPAARPAAAAAGARTTGAGQAGGKQADGALAQDLAAVGRGTTWQLTGRLKLDFPTYHPEGLAIAGGHIFLSSTQIIEPTQKYPTPVDGYDRTPGKGIGHLFVMDPQGHLQKDITFALGDVYHLGGIDSDGTSVWVPVAQYRPNSDGVMFRVDVRSLAVQRLFSFRDHIGGVVLDQTTGRLVGNNWGSRHFYAWDLKGRQVADWTNPESFIDYQDCQYVPSGKMLCGGVTNLPQTAAAGGTNAVYELGGLSLVDLHTHRILNEIPFQQWSTAGHVATRNPVKVVADGSRLTMYAAPDNGDEGAGTEILTYQATVTPAP